MALFGKKDGGVADVIRCDEVEYLVWKWRPQGAKEGGNRENAIRWGSSLRVKDGEVAAFVYKQPNGVMQDFIEGPFDQTLKTSNFPVLSSVLGMAFDGKSPFQAEVYFINLAGATQVKFGVPYFDVFDPRFLDFAVPMAARGSITFQISDYRGFIKQHRLIGFSLADLSSQIKDAVSKYVKAVITNAPTDHGLPVLQMERKILEVSDIVQRHLANAFTTDFGVTLRRFDLSAIEVDKESAGYRELRNVTANQQTQMIEAQTSVGIQNLQDMQAINSANLEETLRIQREEAQRAQRLQTESQNIGAHALNLQAGVLKTAAENLGQMGSMNLGTGSGFNPAGLMTGMALGGAMGGQMANMANQMGNSMQQAANTPPPPPVSLYSVAVNGQTLGPYSMDQLRQMVQTGTLTRQSHVWKQGMAAWEVAGSVRELDTVFQAAPPPPPPPPPPAP